uniref:F-box domain-containing protein n=1 Tax=Davidia involucrata TaxID=16924 RepID=A0A5B6YUS3_DAVIN
MVLSCLSWIPITCKQLVAPFIPRRPCEPLPDDIVIDILSRLPVECVLQCRRVCKQWKALTSTPYFVEIHLKRATPTVIIHLVHHKDIEQFFIDEWGDSIKKMKTRIQKICTAPILAENKYLNPLLNFSYDGLLIFRPKFIDTQGASIIFNPITQEKVTLHNCWGEICGIFFHPLAREYRVIWLGTRSSSVKFKILSLGAQSSWRQLPDFSYMPRIGVPPVILNEALHWMVEIYYAQDATTHFPPCPQSIVIFDIRKEEFHVMPHPGDHEGSICEIKHNQMHLLEIEGRLSLCEFSLCAQVIDIWILEDYAKWFWIRRHTISLELDLKRYPFSYDFRQNCLVRVLGILNGELLLHWKDRGLFAYHLQHGTVRKFERKFEKSGMDGLFTHAYMSLHSKSLVSLRNFKSEIFMEPINY